MMRGAGVSLTAGISDCDVRAGHNFFMRGMEPAVVKKLRSSRAAAQGISVEEAHRRVPRAALVGTRTDLQKNFLDYLRSIPTDGAIAFPRAGDLPWDVSR